MTPVRPSPGFNPFKASNAQLLANGFPERPSGSHDAAWANAVRHFKHWVPPRFETLKNHPGSPLRAPTRSSVAGSAVSAYQSPNWARNVDNIYLYNGIQGQWQVPSVSHSTETSFSSLWPGLGSGSSSANQLVQAGTEQDYASGLLQRYFVWWEIFPRYPYQQKLTNIPVSPGQTVYIDITYSGGALHFFIENVTTGTADSFSESASGYSGNQAEWIVERTEQTSLNGSYDPPLANFGTMTFSGAQAERTNGAWYGVGSLPHYFDTMYANGERLAGPLGIGCGGTCYAVQWANYGASDPAPAP